MELNRALPPQESYYTVAEVAAFLRIAKMTVYRMVGSGELPSRRFGRLIRIPAPAFDKWLAEEGGMQE